MAPTDRSMPAVSTTIVSPADIMNCNEAWRSTLIRLDHVRKCGLRIDSTVISSASAISREMTTNS